ncbi:BrnA antitoxin family protein [Pacificimonas sp. ICDLI1SI03]|jgi:uncharacterized protein (DUF4415 family)|tara:strand:+ start:124730 stop:124987 length:258 start_codon:yes stop_codon:yes gene_type:complete
MSENRPDSPGTWVDPDDAPEWAEEEWARAEIRHGDQIIRPGRPRGRTKERISLRVDKEVLAAYRATGPGWQTRMNADLRKAALGV